LQPGPRNASGESHGRPPESGPRKDLASKLGIGYTGVNRWFKVDDIAISYIYRIAELYGLEVKVKV